MCNSNQLDEIENDEFIKIRSAKTFDELCALIKRQPNHNNRTRNTNKNYNYCSVEKYRTSSYNKSIIDNNANWNIKSQCSHCHFLRLKSNYNNNNKVTTKYNCYPNDTGTVDTFKTKFKCNCHRSNAIDEHINKWNDDNNCICNKCNDWYIKLASNCYRNGFQSHLNYLDNCSKNQRIPIQQTEQLKQTADSLAAQIKPTKAAIAAATTATTILHLPSAALLHRSSESLTQSAHRLKEYCVASCGSDIQVCERHKNRLIHRYRQSTSTIANNTINNKNSLRTFWRQRQSIANPIDRIYDTINAQNTMNSVAIDANDIQANQSQLLSHQGALSKGNFPIDQQQNHQLNHIQRECLAINNKNISTSTRTNNNINYYYHLTDDNNQIPLLPLINDDTDARTSMNDLIHVFNNSLNVYDNNCECSKDNFILPQIILTDFSSDQPTSPITSLTLFAKQSIHLNHSPLRPDV